MYTPPFRTCVIVNVYAGEGAMACLGAASLLGMREVRVWGQGGVGRAHSPPQDSRNE